MVFWQLQIKFEWLIHHSFCLVIFMNLICLTNINLFIIGYFDFLSGFLVCNHFLNGERIIRNPRLIICIRIEHRTCDKKLPLLLDVMLEFFRIGFIRFNSLLSSLKYLELADIDPTVHVVLCQDVFDSAVVRLMLLH